MRIARLICSLLLIVGLLAIPVQSRAQVAVGISVRIGPPVLPVYVQPICPGPGYIWVPGYWAYGPDGYFWVPGTWVFPPEVGLLWTPGYWGPEVGFYGGINYGFGYTGVGFFGGYWRGGTYYYNRSVTNVDVTVVRNTYNTTVVNNNTTINRLPAQTALCCLRSITAGQMLPPLRGLANSTAAARRKLADLSPRTALSKTPGKQIVRGNRWRITGARSKTVLPPRGRRMSRVSILGWSRSNKEK